MLLQFLGRLTFLYFNQSSSRSLKQFIESCCQPIHDSWGSPPLRLNNHTMPYTAVLVMSDSTPNGFCSHLFLYDGCVLNSLASQKRRTAWNDAVIFIIVCGKTRTWTSNVEVASTVSAQFISIYSPFVFRRTSRYYQSCHSQINHMEVSWNGGTPKSSTLINRSFHQKQKLRKNKIHKLFQIGNGLGEKTVLCKNEIPLCETVLLSCLNKTSQPLKTTCKNFSKLEFTATFRFPSRQFFLPSYEASLKAKTPLPSTSVQLDLSLMGGTALETSWNKPFGGTQMYGTPPSWDFSLFLISKHPQIPAGKDHLASDTSGSAMPCRARHDSLIRSLWDIMAIAPFETWLTYYNILFDILNMLECDWILYIHDSVTLCIYIY